MFYNNKIWIGDADGEKICIEPKMTNRHGIIAGATGTGKTITLKVLAESFSNAGVPVFLADVKGDYLTMELDYKPHVIITNPPFNRALEFITKALNDVEDNGYVIMLLRLNFLETKARKEFFDKFMPEYIFVHHKRMSFIEGGGTDSVAYAHYVWRKGYYPEFAKIKVI